MDLLTHPGDGHVFPGDRRESWQSQTPRYTNESISPHQGNDEHQTVPGNSAHFCSHDIMLFFVCLFVYTITTWSLSIHWFIDSFNKPLLNTYYMPNTVLGTWGAAVSKMGPVPVELAI